MPTITDRIHITGYADKLSARPGDAIHFKVSSFSDAAFNTRLTRLISADPNPAGAGIVELACDDLHPQSELRSRVQPFYPGSYAVSGDLVELDQCNYINLGARIFLKQVVLKEQVVAAMGNIELGLDHTGVPYFEIAKQRIYGDSAIPANTWIKLEAQVDLGRGKTVLRAEAVDKSASPFSTYSDGDFGESVSVEAGNYCVAARWHANQASGYFNGKIEAPFLQGAEETNSFADLIRWNFSLEISGTKVFDVGHGDNHGRLVNYPTRGVTGSLWNGEEMSWRHKPEHYAAIHFHEDDIYDFEWQTDFTFSLPNEMPSGIYVMHLEADDHQDSIPFVVCAPYGRPSAKLCVIVPVFTYAIYGNHARPDYHPSWQDKLEKWNAYPHNPANHQEYGLSTYNNHVDGSGICHASHLRPLFNLRPGYLTFGYGEDSGLRHLQADSHLISWLHNQQIDYDVITDYEIHQEGVAALAGYQTVTTMTHPEYHTHESLDGIQDYTRSGGNLMYLGGNGFYWRVALHPENAGILEIRRAEDGIRAWAAEPGEYYSAFDGGYGGLWRRLGRPPQNLVGVGFTAQGNFHGSYYRRKNFDPEMAWLFEGISSDMIGDHGFSGGGAAGFELDRMDYALGTPVDAVLLASSEGHDKEFVLVPEEQLTHLTNTAGEPTDQILRADLVYFSLPGGGQVFSTGSITFCGSLPSNKFENDVSRLLRNVVDRFNG